MVISLAWRASMGDYQEVCYNQWMPHKHVGNRHFTHQVRIRHPNKRISLDTVCRVVLRTMPKLAELPGVWRNRQNAIVRDLVRPVFVPLHPWVQKPSRYPVCQSCVKAAVTSVILIICPQELSPLNDHERRSTSDKVPLSSKHGSMTCVVTTLKVVILLNMRICSSGTGCQEGAQPSRISAHQMARKQSPAMVTYLKEQDAYKCFLVGGHLASRSSIKSETDRASNSTGNPKIDTTSE